MHVKQLFGSDDRAVSPVIGVILMVAVTVILAAVVSMLVLGMGQGVNNNPQATFSFDYNSGGTGAVTITHDGGDTLDNSSVSVNVNGNLNTDDSWPNAKISAGDSYTVLGTSVNPGDTIKVVWHGDNGETAVLATYQVPS